MTAVKQSIEKFIRDESDFSTTLQDIMQKMENPAIQNQTIINPFILIGRIDLIYRYHKFQFMPGLLNIGKEIIIEYIVKHKILLEMYKEIMKRRAIMNLLDIADSSPELKEIIKCIDEPSVREDVNNIFCKALHRYIEFIRVIRDSTLKNSISSRCDFIISIIQSLLDEASPYSIINNTDINYTVATLMVKEIEFFQKFKETMNVAEYHTAESMCGKLPHLVNVKIRILNELKNCIDDYDLLDTTNCFINNIRSFTLYAEHFKLIEMEKIKTKAKQYNNKLINIYNLPLEHLRTYKLLVEECMKKAANKEISIKLNQFKDTLENVLNEINVH